MGRTWSFGLPALLLLTAATLASAEDLRARELQRFGARTSGPRAARVAATTVLTEHPSSLRLMKVHLRQLRGLLAGNPGPAELLRFLERPLMGSGKQLREFRRLSLEQGVATAKMIDYEGKPMPTSVIPRYVRAIERAGMRAGIEGDRFLLLRLPGAAETSAKDQALRERVFRTVVETNLTRLLAGKELPVDRLIVPDTKSVDELMEVHSTYDRVAAEVVKRAVAARRIPAERRAQVLERLTRIQAVPLVEDASTVMNASAMVKDYLGRYRARYGERPKHLVLFVAGSDLNRELGPVGGQLARTVMRSRLARLQRSLGDAVDLIPWAGIGSGPMRSGVGKHPELASMLHPGMTATIQPDQLDQPRRESVIAAIGRAAFGARPERLSHEREARLTGLGAAFVGVHAELSLEHALSTVRIANLLAPLDQRGRKKSSAKLFYEKEGELYLRSVQPAEQGDASTYGRTLDVSTYRECLPSGCARESRGLARAQAAIDRRWPRGLADPRAIAGAFARYVEAEGLTTVAGLGLAIARAERAGYRRELEGLRPMITFLVKNDGFVLTRDRALVRSRIEALQPQLSAAQVERRIGRYFQDRAALERYLGQSVEALVPRGERERYESASRKLYANPALRGYLRGGDLKLTDWLKVMDDLVPLLSHPSWNRIGSLEPPKASAAIA